MISFEDAQFHKYDNWAKCLKDSQFYDYELFKGKEITQDNDSSVRISFESSDPNNPYNLNITIKDNVLRREELSCEDAGNIRKYNKEGKLITYMERTMHYVHTQNFSPKDGRLTSEHITKFVNEADKRIRISHSRTYKSIDGQNLISKVKQNIGNRLDFTAEFNYKRGLTQIILNKNLGLKIATLDTYRCEINNDGGYSWQIKDHNKYRSLEQYEREPVLNLYENLFTDLDLDNIYTRQEGNLYTPKLKYIHEGDEYFTQECDSGEEGVVFAILMALDLIKNPKVDIDYQIPITDGPHPKRIDFALSVPKKDGKIFLEYHPYREWDVGESIEDYAEYRRKIFKNSLIKSTGEVLSNMAKSILSMKGDKIHVVESFEDLYEFLKAISDQFNIKIMDLSKDQFNNLCKEIYYECKRLNMIDVSAIKNRLSELKIA
jgi:hypothetical protein